jgi:hypothetical protein
MRSTGRSARPTTDAPRLTVRRRGDDVRVGAAGGMKRPVRVATVLLIGSSWGSATGVQWLVGSCI